MEKKNAYYFAQELARSGWTITSGLALGIDGASHQGALSVQGNTLAILGTGVEHIYPARHKKLADAISTQGLLISEFPLFTPPTPSNFPRRNRIISGLSQGVLVVEATLKSGSLITARYALEEGREVFAIPGSIHNPLTRGCHHLIRQGAKLVESVNDITEELGLLTHHPVTPHQSRALPPDLEPIDRQLLDCVGFEPSSIHVIMARCSLGAPAVCARLQDLELRGLVVATPGGYSRYH